MARGVPEPGSELDAEGIPDHLGPLPSKDATGDGQEGLVPPRDQPIAADDFGTTAAEQHAGESHPGRLARELPDETAQSPYPDLTAAAGRIVEDDEGARTDTEKDAVAHDVGVDHGGFSAEESPCTSRRSDQDPNSVAEERPWQGPRFAT